MTVTSYDRHVGRYSGELAAGLIRLAGPAPESRVLDVGCGPGGLTAALAAAVGPENVSAVDPSEPFVAEARARVPGADVRLGAAERLPFEDGAFDAAFAQLVLQVLDDPGAGAREMCRVVRPGGLVVAATWDDSAMPYLRAAWDALAAVAPKLAGDVHAPSRVGFASGDELAELLQHAGAEELRVERIAATAQYADFDDLWAPLEAGAGGSGSLIAALDPERLLVARDHAWRAVGSPQGPFGLTAWAWAALGRRPA